MDVAQTQLSLMDRMPKIAIRPAEKLADDFDLISSVFNLKNTVTLYSGDCLDLLKSMPSGAAELIVTSPPYNLGKEYEARTSLNIYLPQQERVIEECYRVLSPTGSICWQVGNYVENGEIVPLDVLLYPIFKQKLGMFLRNRIIWHFGHGLHASKRFSGRYETVLWFTKAEKGYTFNLDPVRIPQKYPSKKHFKGPKQGELSCHPLGKNPTDVWEIPNVKSNHIEKTIHPCQFPVGLIERLVLAMTNEGDLVLDPFIGVGTSAVAALMHNRRAAGAEIEERYLGIARDRIKKAFDGELKTRPMNKPIYEPNGNGNGSSGESL
ncbi:MAG: site-specific DNA-methyltransferase [Actinobacteria bacterium]|nr:site-specific DNA-methyltransferase [Actinomycetota bacterium]